jgi:hypothetical protein
MAATRHKFRAERKLFAASERRAKGIKKQVELIKSKRAHLARERESRNLFAIRQAPGWAGPRGEGTPEEDKARPLQSVDT